MLDGLARFVGTPGVTAVFLFALIENMGVPFPAFPVLMLAGALSRAGGISAGWALCGATLGAVTADAVWYRLGRWRGRKVLTAICRLSLNPDACAEASEGRFHRHPVSTILLAKFVPGLNAATPPLAAITGMPLGRYLLVDGAGSLAWAAAGIGSGWLLGAGAIRAFGAVRGVLGWVVFAGILAFLAWNGLSRYYLVRKYAVPRIPAGELYRKITQGEDVLVVDVRSEASFAASAAMIPSAVRVRPAGFHLAAKDLRPDCELVFYCS